MLGIEFHGIAIRVDVGHQVVPPVVAIWNHVDWHAGPSDNDDSFDRRGLFQALVDRLLEQDFLTTSPATIGRDNQLGLGVVVTIGHRFGTESTEDDRMSRADSGTGEHRDRQFGNHWHVQSDSVASRHAQFLQDVGELADFAVQILIRENTGIAGLPFPDDGRFVLAPGGQMTIQAVVTGIEFAADKPLGIGHISLNDMVPLLEPVEVLSQIAPESGRIIFGSLPHLLVLSFAGDIRLASEFRRGWKTTGFLEDTLNVVTRHREDLLRRGRAGGGTV